MMSGDFGNDFGQKVDLTASIRNILRNYPEGTAVLKELVQNADDAGARTVRFCLDQRGHKAERLADASLAQFQGASLLVYNDAMFTEEDFKSIQRIGDSLKKESESSKAKIGRFGIGFNAVYHWTDLPSFVSDRYLVMLDPQARFLPNVNPSNPGKIVDWLKNRSMVTQFEDQFKPYEMKGLAWNRSFNGTLFRLPLRTREQAETSLLSKRSLSVEEARDLLHNLQVEASSMLLFLKNIEKIQIEEWLDGSAEPCSIFSCEISNSSMDTRSKRMLVTNKQTLDSSSSSIVSGDFSLSIKCIKASGEVYEERWEVCNQLGGHEPNRIASDPNNALLRLVPWGGVAACVSSTDAALDGRICDILASKRAGLAYCFLPLPVSTGLPIMLNGFFELSSNRRDVWQAGADMTGDGRTRALWNISLMKQVIAPSYIRLLLRLRDLLGFCEQFQQMWPVGTLAAPWNEVSNSVLSDCRGIKLLRVSTEDSSSNINGNSLVDAAAGATAMLLSKSAAQQKTFSMSAKEMQYWIMCAQALLLPRHLPSADESVLLKFLMAAKLPIITCISELRDCLEDSKAVDVIVTPPFIRSVLAGTVVPHTTTVVKSGSGAAKQQQHALIKVVPPSNMCKFLLKYCLSDLRADFINAELDGINVLPLENGRVGTLQVFSSVQAQALNEVISMGFSMSQALPILVASNFNVHAASEQLFAPDTTRSTSQQHQQQQQNSQSNNENKVYIICDAAESSVFSAASSVFISRSEVGPSEMEFICTPFFQRHANIRSFQPSLVPDLLKYILPNELLQGSVVSFEDMKNGCWKPSSAKDDSALETMNFLVAFWKYASGRKDVLSAIAQGAALLPSLRYNASSSSVSLVFLPLSRMSNLLVHSLANQQHSTDSDTVSANAHDRTTNAGPGASKTIVEASAAAALPPSKDMKVMNNNVSSGAHNHSEGSELRLPADVVEILRVLGVSIVDPLYVLEASPSININTSTTVTLSAPEVATATASVLSNKVNAESLYEVWTNCSSASNNANNAAAGNNANASKFLRNQWADMSPVFWEYVHRPTRSGVLAALEFTLRDRSSGEAREDQLNSNQREQLRLFIASSEAVGFVSAAESHVIRKLPIFRVVSPISSAEAGHVCHKYISLAPASIFENASASSTASAAYSYITVLDDDRIPTTLLPENYITHINHADFELLKHVGVKVLSRVSLIKDHILPNIQSLHATNFVDTESFLLQMMSEIKSLSREDGRFMDFLSSIPFVPCGLKSDAAVVVAAAAHGVVNKDMTSSVSTPSTASNSGCAGSSLFRAKDLFDPAEQELVTLLDPVLFPRSSFAHEEILVTLRSIGLKRDLGWQGVLMCAKSIADLPDYTADIINSVKLNRSYSLLKYLNKNIPRLIGEDSESERNGTGSGSSTSSGSSGKPAVKSKSKSIFASFLSVVNSAVMTAGGDDAAERNPRDYDASSSSSLLTAEQLAVAQQHLRSIAWLPVLVDCPHDCMPWPAEAAASSSSSSSSVVATAAATAAATASTAESSGLVSRLPLCAAPAASAPYADAWMCSASKRILAIGCIPTERAAALPLLVATSSSSRDSSSNSTASVERTTGGIAVDCMHMQLSSSLNRIFGWNEPLSVQVIAQQLQELSSTFFALQSKIQLLQYESSDIHSSSSSSIGASMQAVREKITALIPQLYQRLNATLGTQSPASQAASGIILDTLNMHSWIWVGHTFVSTEKVALTASVSAAPYLYQLPQDLQVYTKLISLFKIKPFFSSRDYVLALREMAQDSGEKNAYNDKVVNNTSTGSSTGSTSSICLSDALLEVAVSLVTLLGAEPASALSAQEIYIPDNMGRLAPARELVNDDVPWLSGPEYLSIRSGCRLVHPHVSSMVAEKMGVVSLRVNLLKQNLDQNLFGSIPNNSAASAAASGGVTDGVESFGQAESLTSRLKTILDLYPDGNPIFSELLQNADDAGASCMSILLDENTYPVESLLDSRMAPLQGPSLIVRNDAVFTEADFRSLARIGHGSKLEKLATTGRFGLGFNSTYHLTDTPTFVSGEHLVIFDPHCAFAPGATMNQPGLKIKFQGSHLPQTFKNQFEPFHYFGCDFKSPYNGTLFRFPLRSASLARSSEISKRSYTLSDLEANLHQLIGQLPNMLLFLRNVRTIEIHRCDRGSRVPQLLHRAFAAPYDVKKYNDQSLLRYFDKMNDKTREQTSNVSSGGVHAKTANGAAAATTTGTTTSTATPSRDHFYHELQNTPESKLPLYTSKMHIVVTSYAGRSFGAEDEDGEKLNKVAAIDSSGSSSTSRTAATAATAVTPTTQAYETSLESDFTVGEQQKKLMMDMLVVTGMGAGDARRMACDPSTRQLKLVPMGAVAALISYQSESEKNFGSVSETEEPDSPQALNGGASFMFPKTNGIAFSFLPLPVVTQLPVHVNAYWELSSNRRDIWQGADTKGEAKLRSDWNICVMKDVLAPLYVHLLSQMQELMLSKQGKSVGLLPPPATASGASSSTNNAVTNIVAAVTPQQAAFRLRMHYQLLALLPASPLPAAPWHVVAQALFPLLNTRSAMKATNPSTPPLFWSSTLEKYVTLSEAHMMVYDLEDVQLPQEKLQLDKLLDILKEEKVSVVVAPQSVVRAIVDVDANTGAGSSSGGNASISSNAKGEVTPAMIRRLYSVNESEFSGDTLRSDFSTSTAGGSVAAGIARRFAARHPSLAEDKSAAEVLSTASFLLQYCFRDISRKNYGDLRLVHLLPLEDGSLGVLGDPMDGVPRYYMVGSDSERKLLSKAGERILASEALLGQTVCSVLKDPEFESQGNISSVSVLDALKLITSFILPKKWMDNNVLCVNYKDPSVNLTDDWLVNLWSYVLHGRYLDFFKEVVPMLPVLPPTSIPVCCSVAGQPLPPPTPPPVSIVAAAASKKERAAVAAPPTTAAAAAAATYGMHQPPLPTTPPPAALVARSAANRGVADVSPPSYIVKITDRARILHNMYADKTPPDAVCGLGDLGIYIMNPVVLGNVSFTPEVTSLLCAPDARGVLHAFNSPHVLALIAATTGLSYAHLSGCSRGGNVEANDSSSAAVAAAIAVDQDQVQRMRSWSRSRRLALRDFILDNVLGKVDSLLPQDIRTLCALPVWMQVKSSSKGSSGTSGEDRAAPMGSSSEDVGGVISAMEPSKFMLAPRDIAPQLLGAHFLHLRSDRDRLLYQLLGVKELTRGKFYADHVVPRLIHGTIDTELVDDLTSHVLRNLSVLEEEQPGLSAALAECNIIRNNSGTLCAPKTLYDPTAPHLSTLLSPSMFPSNKLYTAEGTSTVLLQSMRTLGLKNTVSCDGIIEAARSIQHDCELSASLSSTSSSAAASSFSSSAGETLLQAQAAKVDHALKRAKGLIHYLNESIDRLVTEAETGGADGSSGSSNSSSVGLSTASNTSSISASPGGRWAAILRSIAWVPVLTNRPASALNPSATAATTSSPASLSSEIAVAADSDTSANAGKSSDTGTTALSLLSAACSSLPWPTKLHSSASPLATPAQCVSTKNMWLASASHRVSSVDIQSELLLRVLGWDKPVIGRALTVQLLETKVLFDKAEGAAAAVFGTTITQDCASSSSSATTPSTSSSSAASASAARNSILSQQLQFDQYSATMRESYRKSVSSLLLALNAALEREPDAESARWRGQLAGRPVVWLQQGSATSGRFVEASRIAFSALNNLNTEPFLFVAVTAEMLAIKPLLLALGSKEHFEAADLANLTRELYASTTPTPRATAAGIPSASAASPLSAAKVTQCVGVVKIIYSMMKGRSIEEVNRDDSSDDESDNDDDDDDYDDDYDDSDDDDGGQDNVKEPGRARAAAAAAAVATEIRTPTVKAVAISASSVGVNGSPLVVATVASASSSDVMTTTATTAAAPSPIVAAAAVETDSFKSGYKNSADNENGRDSFNDDRSTQRRAARRQRRVKSNTVPSALKLSSLGVIYIPSVDNVLFPSTALTYDDAEWISSLVPHQRNNKGTAGGSASSGAIKFVTSQLPVRMCVLLGCKSLREQLFAGKDMMCPSPDYLRPLVKGVNINSRNVAAADSAEEETAARAAGAAGLYSTILDLIALVDSLGCGSVTFLSDERTYSAQSLMNPGFSSAQGPALVAYIQGRVMTSEDVSKALTLPVFGASSGGSSSSTSTGGSASSKLQHQKSGAAAASMGSNTLQPCEGRRLLGTFTITDCLQILSGDEYFVVDPSGMYLLSSASSNDASSGSGAKGSVASFRRHNATSSSGGPTAHSTSKAQRFSLRKSSTNSNSTDDSSDDSSNNVLKQFPDQFLPFFSLPFGAKESMLATGTVKGTIIRMPLRGRASRISHAVCDIEHARSIFGSLKNNMSASVLFAKSLKNISLMHSREAHSSSSSSSSATAQHVAVDGQDTDGRRTILHEKAVSDDDTAVDESLQEEKEPSSEHFQDMSITLISDTIYRSKRAQLTLDKGWELQGVTKFFNSVVSKAYVAPELHCTVQLQITINTSNGWMELSPQLKHAVELQQRKGRGAEAVSTDFRQTVETTPKEVSFVELWNVSHICGKGRLKTLARTEPFNASSCKLQPTVALAMRVLSAEETQEDVSVSSSSSSPPPALLAGLSLPADSGMCYNGAYCVALSGLPFHVDCSFVQSPSFDARLSLSEYSTTEAVAMLQRSGAHVTGAGAVGAGVVDDLLNVPAARWNEAALMTVLDTLYPQALGAMKKIIETGGGTPSMTASALNKKGFYKYWPFLPRLTFFARRCFDKSSASNMLAAGSYYLTSSTGFSPLGCVILPVTPFPATVTALLEDPTIGLAKCPPQLAADLRTVQVTTSANGSSTSSGLTAAGAMLTPTLLRSMMEKHAQWFTGRLNQRFDVVSHLLTYALSDMHLAAFVTATASSSSSSSNSNYSSVGSFTRQTRYKELYSCPLIPMANGRVGRVPRTSRTMLARVPPVFIALLPALTGSFVHPDYTYLYDSLLDGEGTADTLFSETLFIARSFTAAFLARYVSYILPTHWDNALCVAWSPVNPSTGISECPSSSNYQRPPTGADSDRFAMMAAKPTIVASSSDTEDDQVATVAVGIGPVRTLHNPLAPPSELLIFALWNQALHSEPWMALQELRNYTLVPVVSTDTAGNSRRLLLSTSLLPFVMWERNPSAAQHRHREMLREEARKMQQVGILSSRSNSSQPGTAVNRQAVNSSSVTASSGGGVRNENTISSAQMQSKDSWGWTSQSCADTVKLFKGHIISDKQRQQQQSSVSNNIGSEAIIGSVGAAAAAAESPSIDNSTSPSIGIVIDSSAANNNNNGGGGGDYNSNNFSASSSAGESISSQLAAPESVLPALRSLGMPFLDPSIFEDPPVGLRSQVGGGSGGGGNEGSGIAVHKGLRLLRCLHAMSTSSTFICTDYSANGASMSPDDTHDSAPPPPPPPQAATAAEIVGELTESVALLQFDALSVEHRTSILLEIYRAHTADPLSAADLNKLRQLKLFTAASSHHKDASAVAQTSSAATAATATTSTTSVAQGSLSAGFRGDGGSSNESVPPSKASIASKAMTAVLGMSSRSFGAGSGAGTGSSIGAVAKAGPHPPAIALAECAAGGGVYWCMDSSVLEGVPLSSISTTTTTSPSISGSGGQAAAGISLTTTGAAASSSTSSSFSSSSSSAPPVILDYNPQLKDLYTLLEIEELTAATAVRKFIIPTLSDLNPADRLDRMLKLARKWSLYREDEQLVNVLKTVAFIPLWRQEDETRQERSDLNLVHQMPSAAAPAAIAPAAEGIAIKASSAPVTGAGAGTRRAGTGTLLDAFYANSVQLRRADELFLWTNNELAATMCGPLYPLFFPPPFLCQHDLHVMFTDLGMAKDITDKNFEPIALAIQCLSAMITSVSTSSGGTASSGGGGGGDAKVDGNSSLEMLKHQLCELGRQLLRYLLGNDRISDVLQNNNFAKGIGRIKFVPMQVPSNAVGVDGGHVSYTEQLGSFDQLLAEQHGALGFTVMPILDADITPPPYFLPLLGVTRTPTLEVVLRHVRNLTRRGEVLDRWNAKYTIPNTFNAIYQFLFDNWRSVTTAVREGLALTHIVPVGHTLVKPSRLFFRLAEDLSPFMHEIPRHFGAHEAFLKSLGIKESPSIADYQGFLIDLKGESRETSLNPNELRAVVAILSSIATQWEAERVGGESALNSNSNSKNGRNSAASLTQTLCVPDENSVMRFVNQCLVNDNPWLCNIAESTLTQSDMYILHPSVVSELSSAQLSALNMLQLSEAVTETLSSSSSAAPISLPSAANEPMLQQLYSKVICASSFHEALAALLSSSAVTGTVTSAGAGADTTMPSLSGAGVGVGAIAREIAFKLSAVTFRFVQNLPTRLRCSFANNRAAASAAGRPTSAEGIETISFAEKITQSEAQASAAKAAIARSSASAGAGAGASPVCPPPPTTRWVVYINVPAVVLPLTLDIAVASGLCSVVNLPAPLAASLACLLGATAFELQNNVSSSSSSNSPQNNNSALRIMHSLKIGRNAAQAREHLRGTPGEPVTVSDLQLLELRPFRVFRAGEVVAVEDTSTVVDSFSSSPHVVMRYAKVLSVGEVSENGEIRKLTLRISGATRLQPEQQQVAVKLSTEVYSFKSAREIVSASAPSSSSSADRSLIVSTGTAPKSQHLRASAERAYEDKNSAGTGRFKLGDEPGIDTTDFGDSSVPPHNHTVVSQVELMDALKGLMGRSGIPLSMENEALISRIVELEAVNRRMDTDLQSERTQLTAVQQSLNEATSSTKCSICVTNDVSHVLVPCGHTFCETCVNQLQRNRCPNCRQNIQQKIKFFLEGGAV